MTDKRIFRSLVVIVTLIAKEAQAMMVNVSVAPPAPISAPAARATAQPIRLHENRYFESFYKKVPYVKLKHTFVQKCLSQLSFDDSFKEVMSGASGTERIVRLDKLGDNLERMGAFLSNLHDLRIEQQRRKGWISFLKRSSLKLFEYILEGTFSWPHEEGDVTTIQALESELAQISGQTIENSHEVVQKLLIENIDLITTIEEFLKGCPEVKTISIESSIDDTIACQSELMHLASADVNSIIKATFDFLSTRVRKLATGAAKSEDFTLVIRDAGQKRSGDARCQKKIEQAIKDYEWIRSHPAQAAQSSYERACNDEVWLGEVYFLGKFFEKDHRRAKAYFKKAAKRIVPFFEQPRAWSRLGEQYLQGKGTQKNPKKGFMYLNKAAEQKSNGIARATALTIIAESYLFGDSVEIDYAKAITYLQQVAEQDASTASRAVAWSRLADLYWWGMGVKRDHILAREYYEKVDATEMPADYQPGIYPKAVAWQRLGDIYLQGDGVAANHDKANSYFNKAMQQHHNREARAHAWLRLGEAYLFGNGVQRNGEKAFELLNKAVSQQDSKETRVWAHLGLGTYYYLIKGDMAKSRQIYKKIAAQTEVKEAQKTAQEFLKPL